MSAAARRRRSLDRKSTRLNSSHGYISYAVFWLKKLPRADLRVLPFDREPRVSREFLSAVFRRPPRSRLPLGPPRLRRCRGVRRGFFFSCPSRPLRGPPPPPPGSTTS